MSQNSATTPEFSTVRFVLIVFSISYPFQIAYHFLGEAYRPILLVSMAAAGLGAFVCGCFVFRDGFAGAGWAWGRFRHYLLAFALAALFWVFPSLVEHYTSLYTWKPGVEAGAIAMAILSGSVLTIIPAFGEELAWRGYLLPRLVARKGVRGGLITMGFITWLWHLPFLVTTALQESTTPLASLALVLGVSLIPTVLHAVIFAYLWNVSGSIAVAIFYHVVFDEIRDGLIETIGLGALGQNWQVIPICLIGGILLYRTNWYRPISGTRKKPCK